jgi:hypothetical protein
VQRSHIAQHREDNRCGTPLAVEPQQLFDVQTADRLKLWYRHFAPCPLHVCNMPTHVPRRLAALTLPGVCSWTL